MEDPFTLMMDKHFAPRFFAYLTASKLANKVLEAKDLFMIGRGLDYSILLEGSLKLKEVSYIHSEADIFCKTFLDKEHDVRTS